MGGDEIVLRTEDLGLSEIMIRTFRSLRYSVLSPQSSVLLLLLLSGCAALGVAAHALPPPMQHPKYTGLANQSIGVMVWADRGIQIDWPTLQVDLANAIQKRLVEQPKAKTLLGATYPVQPASIVRYQRDHPEIEAMQIVDVAPKLGVSRLIYVELEDFATRSDMAVELFRGQAKATVRVIEIDGAKAKLAWEQNDVFASYPPKAPKEGIPSVGDARIYSGTVDALGTTIARLFYPWRPEEHE